MSIPTVSLQSGRQMPRLGLGTWRLTGSECTTVVRQALDLGYRHIDTADAYGNHAEVGAAIAGHDREALFITSKVPPSLLEHDDLFATCHRNLQELGTEYLDLYLIHWPNPELPMEPTFEALASLYEQGKVRSVGVSNFIASRLQTALDISAVPICTNQVEFHPLLYQARLLEFCNSHGVVVTAYSPLGRQKALEHPVVRQVAEQCGKTPAQVCLRWLLQKGLVVIPKASSETRLRENMDVFDWDLPPEVVQQIDELPDQQRLIRMELDEFDEEQDAG